MRAMSSGCTLAFHALRVVSIVPSGKPWMTAYPSDIFTLSMSGS